MKSSEPLRPMTAPSSVIDTSMHRRSTEPRRRWLWAQSQRTRGRSVGALPDHRRSGEVGLDETVPTGHRRQAESPADLSIALPRAALSARVAARLERSCMRSGGNGIVDWPNGAWRRLSIEADGHGPSEVSEVWWLQCDRHFADIRVSRSADPERLPYSSTQAFAGHASYDPATHTMEWVSRFDTEDRSERSSAHVYPCEGNPRLMREDGDAYTEYWGRMDVGDEPGRVAESGSSLRVQVGEYAVTLERVGSRTVGTLFTCDGSAWIARLTAAETQID